MTVALAHFPSVASRMARRPLRKAILEGKPLNGLWFSRPQEYAARNRDEDFGRFKYATEEELVLSPLPCWADCKAEEYRERVAGLTFR